MTVIGFPGKTPDTTWTKPKTLEDWPWEKDLGKPHMDINDPLDAAPPARVQVLSPARVQVFETREQMKQAEKNDLSRYKDASPAAMVCREAADLLDGDRAKQHGDKLALHRTMANLLTAYLDRPIKPSEAAMVEALVKVARTKHGLLNEDDYRDGAAYMGISWECANVGC